MPVIFLGIAAIVFIIWGVLKLRNNAIVIKAQNELEELNLEEEALDLKGELVEKKIELQTKSKKIDKRKGKLDNEL